MVILNGELFQLDCQFIGQGVLSATTCSCKTATRILAPGRIQITSRKEKGNTNCWLAAKDPGVMLMGPKQQVPILVLSCPFPRWQCGSAPSPHHPPVDARISKSCSILHLGYKIQLLTWLSFTVQLQLSYWRCRITETGVGISRSHVEG